MHSLILALCFTAAGASPTADREIAEHELPPGTTITVGDDTVRLEVPSYLITRTEAEDLLLAEWERDQAVAALEAQEPEPFPWATVLAVVGVATVVSFVGGAALGLYLR